MNRINEKLQALREIMQSEQLGAYIIPTNGPHMSEYVADHWNHREWISGFTGSAGTVVVTPSRAGLWTDARYYLQAEEELAETGIDLFRMSEPGVPSISTWLTDACRAGDRVGAASLTVMTAQIEDYKKVLDGAQLEFVTTGDLVGQIRKERPAMSTEKIYEHDITYAGKSRQEKLTLVRSRLTGNRADALLVTALDEIGWVLNLRGRDVAFNPVFYAYLWVEHFNCYLFVDEQKVDGNLRSQLEKDGIELIDYNSIYKKIKKLSKEKKVAIDYSVTNARIFNQLRADRIIKISSPIKHIKAIKTTVEIKHLRRVMIKDGVALVRAFRWLERTLQARDVSEYEFGSMLATFRSEQAGYVGESFSPIVGYESNGAIIHYRADKEKCKSIAARGVLLVDSGGQYLDGTTDITRTIALSEPTEEQKIQYTLVLKGHIALAKAHFPKGTTGIQLDTLARQFLWNENLDYTHGTGHGVGFFMNVHEPPQGFANKLTERGKAVHKAGMYSSNEPGYYEPGSHGIRIENLVVCVPAGDPARPNFLRFDTITLFPFDLNFIKRSIMTKYEVAWMNSYHRKVEKKLLPHLNEEESAWLIERCRRIK